MNFSNFIDSIVLNNINKFSRLENFYTKFEFINPIIPGLFDVFVAPWGGAFFARGHISTLAYALNLKFGTKVLLDKSTRKNILKKSYHGCLLPWQPS